MERKYDRENSFINEKFHTSQNLITYINHMWQFVDHDPHPKYLESHSVGYTDF